MQSWRLRSPKICRWPAGAPGGQMVKFRSESDTWETRRTDTASSSPKAGGLEIQGESIFPFSPRARKDPWPSLMKQKKLSDSAFCSAQIFCWWDEAHPLEGGRAVCFTQSFDLNGHFIQQHLTDIPRITSGRISGYCMAQSGWHVRWKFGVGGGCQFRGHLWLHIPFQFPKDVSIAKLLFM